MALRDLQDYRERAGILDEDVEAFLADVDRRLLPHLKRALRDVPTVEPLNGGMAHQILSGGKRIRAALCVSSCELFGSPYLRALNYAAAIEHMQNFTLVHDDIADGDPLRRSQEALWVRFGIAHGVNLGDMFIPLAALAVLRSPYSERTKLRLLQVMCEYGLQMAEGQSIDINLRSSDTATAQDYMDCTKKKTGAFLAMAAVGGGIIGGATRTQLAKLRDFAFTAGVAFQIKDDILDVEGTKGRAIGSDVLEGKRTLLVIHAARNASGVQRRRLFAILNKPRAEKIPEEVEWVFDLYRRTRARDYAELMANRLVDEASEHLMALPDSEPKFRILRLSRYLSRRTH
jgi:geranylgeranyl diphosphate synthase type I